MITEQDLARALRTIADRAENRDMLAGLRVERRRRVRRRVTGALAAVCVVLLGWGVLVAWPVPRAVDTAEPGPDAAARVWPDAVFAMPGGIRPMTAISATELLVWSERGTMEIYDAAAGRSRVIATLPQEPRLRAVDAERVVWRADDGNVWVAPLRTGGKPIKAGAIRDENVDRIALAGRYVVWSSPLDGVWRMRVDGGAPERVAGSKGLQLVEWPWATDEPLDTRTNPTRVVNLETGRAVEIRPVPGAEGLRCGPTWCAGRRGADDIVQRGDGSRSRSHRGGGLRGYPYRDRFFVGAGRIYDARADRTVTFEGGKLPSGGRTWSSGDGVIFWTEGTGRRVVNLAAVPGP